MDNKAILERLEAHNLKQTDLAEMLGIGQDKVSKVFSGVRQWRGNELTRVIEWLENLKEPDQLVADGNRDYLPVEILPSFAGMGGGGSGEGDVEAGMVPRRLIEDELRAKPKDMLLIEARGDSMLPDFQHGDQILIDRRDIDPIQPGSFALWDGDGYVIKLIERVPQSNGAYRVFSSNGRYSDYEVSADDIKIMGRPVWFARRL